MPGNRHSGQVTESRITTTTDGPASDAAEVRARYAVFVDHDGVISPHYSALAAAVRDDEATCLRIAELPRRCHMPNLLFAAVRLVTGSVPQDGPDLLNRLRAHWEPITEVMRTRHVQTNEVNRCAVLLAAFERVTGPFALIEVGASAGLCLRPDAYHYTYRRPGGVTAFGAEGAGVRLDCEIRAGAPVPSRLPEIVWRAGLDPRPISPADQVEVDWLTALVFPDQAGRRQRLESALADARRDPPRIVTGDLIEDLPALVAQAPTDVPLVISHSAMLPYVEPPRRRRFVSLVAELGATRIALEGAQGLSALGVGPGAPAEGGRWSPMWLAVDNEVIGEAHPHGEWLAAPPAG